MFYNLKNANIYKEDNMIILLKVSLCHKLKQVLILVTKNSSSSSCTPSTSK